MNAKGPALADEPPDESGRCRPLIHALPRLSRESVLWRNRAFAALDGLTAAFDGQTLVARLDFAAKAKDLGWFAFDSIEGRLLLSPTWVGGEPACRIPTQPSPTLTRAVRQLSALEPLIVALEVAAGVALEPAGPTTWSGEAVQLSLADSSGSDVHRVFLALDAQLASALRPAPIGSGETRLAAAAAMPAELVVARIRVPMAELGALEVGDMVLTDLTADETWPVRLAPRHCRRHALGLYHRRAGTVEVKAWTAPLDPAGRARTMQTRAAKDEDAGVDAPALARAHAPDRPIQDLVVDLRIAIANVTIPFGQLSRLGPGCVVDVAGGENLEVELQVNGARIGTGRLVALGRGYGVEVTDLGDA